MEIRALNPARVGAMASKKRVAVTNFKNDRVGLSGKIEAELASKRLNGRAYFTLLSRKDLNKILAEQKLQSSEMVDASTATRVGEIIGAQAIITGEVALANAESSSYRKNTKECLGYYKNGRCAKWHFYQIRCNTTKASVSANINIIDVAKGTIIYADTYVKNYSGDSCRDNYNGSGQILSKAQALNRLTSQIATDFVYKLTPNYTYITVTLLDSIKLESATDREKKEFENALKYIEATRYDRAKKILSKLIDLFDGKSYVVDYDMGIVYEATGDLERAKEFYTMADNVTPEPIDEVNEAMIRIDRLIAKQNEAQAQIHAE
ncbi:hypothetical protein MNB_SM-5-565 [hydrothermal vent metagenome]|uniref:Uncharacterized protein n=1 Tax=hydrothermal vent metagenome TaxID=652676 RepID=A0A1W1CDU0_9ZZZZ